MLITVLIIFYTFIGVNQSHYTNCSATKQSISDWFNYPIGNFLHPLTESLISACSSSLKKRNAFAINSFLSSYGLSKFKQDILAAHYNKQHIYRTVFQDKGNLTNFAQQNHSRNHVLYVELSYAKRTDLPIYFENIYMYPPLLSFLELIVRKSGVYSHNEHNDNILYLSQDKYGSMYSVIAQPSQHGNWHYDQHPFSCVYMINKPTNGGIFKYLSLTQPASNNDTKYWHLLKLILNKSKSVEHLMSTIEVDEGGLYCFTGNSILHHATKVEGSTSRAVLVMTYATQHHFNHNAEWRKNNL
eukprot:244104_1